jgi:hypothetical protein
MLNDVFRGRFSVQSPSSGARNSATLTVGISGIPRVKAHAQLAGCGVFSYTDNPWEALVFIREYCYRTAPDQIQCAYEPDPYSAPNFVEIFNGTRITFEVMTSGPLAWARALTSVYVFV